MNTLKAIQTLKDEHQYILRMLKVVRELSIHTMNSKEVYYEGFHKAIDFIRNFADKYHHGKEEDLLFEIMSNELGEAIKNGPIYGMLAEHDLGRLFIKNLEDALIAHENGKEEVKVDIVANAVCYTDLLYRHIDKEDNAIFNFAADKLKQETLEAMEIDFNKKQEELESDETKRKYIELLTELEGYVAKL